MVYQLCPECHNHYDDSFQQKKCLREGGVNIDTEHDGIKTFHRPVGPKPVEAANIASKGSRTAQRAT